MSILPFEILELVLDDLADEKDCLAQLSLISRALLEPCQRRLYNSVSLDHTAPLSHTKSTALQLTLAGNPLLSSYVQDLSIASSRFEQYLNLPNLRTLSITIPQPSRNRLFTLFDEVAEWRSLPPGFQSSIKHLLSTPLLTHVSFNNLAEFPIPLLSTCVDLESLTLECKYNSFVTPRLEGDIKDGILPSTRSLPGKLGNSNLRTFKLIDLGVLEGPQLQVYRDIVADPSFHVLEELHLCFCMPLSNEYLLEFTHMATLRYISLNLHADDSAMPCWLLHLLRSMHSPTNLEKLTINLIDHSSQQPSAIMRGEQWRDVDKLLTGPSFPSFHEFLLNIKKDGGRRYNDAELTTLREKLPILGSKSHFTLLDNSN